MLAEGFGRPTSKREINSALITSALGSQLHVLLKSLINIYFIIAEPDPSCSDRHYFKSQARHTKSCTMSRKHQSLEVTIFVQANNCPPSRRPRRRLQHAFLLLFRRRIRSHVPRRSSRSPPNTFGSLVPNPSSPTPNRALASKLSRPYRQY